MDDHTSLDQRFHNLRVPSSSSNVERCGSLGIPCVRVCAGLGEVDGHIKVVVSSGHMKSSEALSIDESHVGSPAQKDPDDR